MNCPAYSVASCSACWRLSFFTVNSIRSAFRWAVDARGVEKLPRGEPLDADRVDRALRDVRHPGELRLRLGDALGLLVDGRVLGSSEGRGEVLAGEQHLRGRFVERGLPEREEHRGSRSEHEGGQNDPLVPQNDADVVP